MFKLKVISSSTRPGRKGPKIASWVLKQVKAHGTFEAEMVDLGELNLPLMDERNHPSAQQYEHEHTKRWSAMIDSADAFVFVTAEYNFSYPAPLKNALDYLYNEWTHKAAGIVSYGGISGGLRAANRLKEDLSSYKIMPLTSFTPFPSFEKLINSEGAFVPNEISVKSIRAMLDELLEATTVLAGLRK